jgi:hypothetical protein
MLGSVSDSELRADTDRVTKSYFALRDYLQRLGTDKAHADFQLMQKRLPRRRESDGRPRLEHQAAGKLSGVGVDRAALLAGRGLQSPRPGGRGAIQVRSENPITRR